MKNILLGLFLFTSILGFSQNVITITDDDLQGNNSYGWTPDNIYLLDGYVFLEEGGSLNIAPGTIIKGKEIPTTGDVASALIIARGAQIFAQGTPNQPIIFTSESDDTTDPNDKTETDRGEWGGLVILGKGIIGDETTEAQIEGFELENDPRVLYGGSENSDNSGILRYVSIRHGGSVLEDGDEINGLTLGAVGDQTTLEYIEVFANDDDGIEWFGGAANVKFAAVAFCADDPFDWDTGFRGKGQFWFGIQGLDDGGNGGEHDGAIPDDNPIFADPTVYNATYIGMGADNTNDPSSEYGILFRDGTAGDYANSIITDFSFFALQVEDTDNSQDSRLQLENGNLTLKNNIWFGFGEGSELATADNINSIINTTDVAVDNGQWLVDHLAANSNTIEDPQLGGISRTTDGNLDPRPNSNGPAFSNLADLPNDPFFTEVDFKGAFGSSLWIRDWTALDEYGFLPTRNEIVIRDSDLEGNNTYNWTSDNIYLLDGYVFLEEGGVLNIEAGTVIKGQEIPTTGDVASALIIARGAQIFAEGTAEAPIIFTSESDDTTDPNDKAVTDRGEWGGLVILGKGIIGDETTEAQIEGFELENDPRVLYGGNDNTDNSGVLTYVSVRHGGSVLEDGDEINGITLGAVGSGTTIHHVEVISNDDDGIEWFGGAAEVKYAAVAFCADDPFDWDTGFRGKGQFWFGIQGLDDGGNGGEHDGAIPDDNPIFADPTVYNATYIGMGADNTNDPSSEYGILFRDGTAGDYANSIITDFSFFALQVEDTDNSQDSRLQLENGNLTLKNNIWFGFGEGSELATADNVNSIINTTDVAVDNGQWLVDHLAANSNTIEDPQINGISRMADGGLDPRVQAGSPAFSNLADFPDDDFFTRVNFKGAFNSSATWMKGWTALSEYGVLDFNVPGVNEYQGLPQNVIIVKDEDLQDGTYNWTNENIYQLDGYVFLEEGGTLNIQPGTYIKGQEIPSTGDVASALIITRGAQIFAEGTCDQPIIFTSESDDIADPNDKEPTDRGEWGGLVILGNGVIGDETTEAQIEGFELENDSRVLYGGDNNEDNSGILTYVSIRHGGSVLEDGDEINGLTLGAVGSGTTLHHIEVFANDDDGIEWFGGAANVKYASVSFCADDPFDWDTGFRGFGQFWFGLQGEDDGGNGGEHDGAIPDDNPIFADPVVYNATYIGMGQNNTNDPSSEYGLLFRDGSAGDYANSIITDFSFFAIQVEDTDNSQDSRGHLERGDLTLKNNIWFGFGEGSELATADNVNSIINTTDVAVDNGQWLVDHLAANGNTIEDPQLGGISRTANGQLDPRVDENGPAFSGEKAALPGNEFFDEVSFKGAFGSTGTWLAGWTALSEYGILDPSIPQDDNCLVNVANKRIESENFVNGLVEVWPNPTSDFQTSLNFSLKQNARVTIHVLNQLGQVISTPVQGEKMFEGDNTVQLEMDRMNQGIYYYSLQIENGSPITGKIVVLN